MERHTMQNRKRQMVLKSEGQIITEDVWLVDSLTVVRECKVVGSV